MNNIDVYSLISTLISNFESEILEFKEAKQTFKVSEIGRYFSALSNEANLRDARSAWLLLGVRDDGTVCGSSFRREAESPSKGLQRLKKEIAEQTNNRITLKAIYEVDLDGKRVVALEVPPAARGIPTLWAGAAYAREDESLVPLSMSKIDEIRSQPQFEWGKLVVDATLEDLDPEAVSVLRGNVRERYGERASLVDSLSDEELLDKTGLTLRGLVTNAALALVGQKESRSFVDGATPTLTWTLYESDGRERAHEHFWPPFLISIDGVLAKIRNEKIRIMDNPSSLLPTELSEYDSWSIRELIGNAIAHQDYGFGRRVNIEEFPDRLVIINEGCFIPGTIEKALSPGYKPPRYRNPFICEAMLHIGMLDQNAMGIRTVFENCRSRRMPLPTYDLSDPCRVSVTLFNRELDSAYGQILRERPELPMETVFQLDKVQKSEPISAFDEEELVKGGLAARGEDGRLRLIAPKPSITNDGSIEKASSPRYLGLKAAICEILEIGPMSRNEILRRIEESDRWSFDPAVNASHKVYRELLALEKEGVVRKSGKTRAVVWYLAR